MRFNTEPETGKQRYAVVLTDDLFFSSKIRQAAKSQGLAVDFIKSPGSLIDTLVSRPPSVIILDLNCKKFEPIALIGEIKSNPCLREIPMIGYLPHVNTDLKLMAAEAGCDTVLPRSRFAMEIVEILRGFAAD